MALKCIEDGNFYKTITWRLHDEGENRQSSMENVYIDAWMEECGGGENNI